jgi:hypothetical protein
VADGVRVEARVWIDRPLKDVFAYVTSLDKWPAWRHDVVGGRVLTEGELGVGSRAQGLARVVGRTVMIDVVDAAAVFGGLHPLLSGRCDAPVMSLLTHGPA